MGKFQKTVVVSFFILLIVIIAEVFYYYKINGSGPGLTGNTGKTGAAGQNALPEVNESAVANDSYFQYFQSIFYDKETKQCDMNKLITFYVKSKESKAVDFPSWIAIAGYTKDSVDTLTLTRKIHGVISQLNIKEGNGGIRFVLEDDKNNSFPIVEHPVALDIIKFVKRTNGVETPIKLEDLKNGDSLIIESQSDITRPVNDPDHYIEKKYIVTYD